jgi:hypothetical protein
VSAKQQGADYLAMSRNPRATLFVDGRGRASIGHDSCVDTRTKLLIVGMVLLVLTFLVIGGILAITSPPSSCC